MSVISNKSAKSLLLDLELDDGSETNSLKCANLSKEQRQSFYKNNKEVDLKKICATIEIQRVYRGYRSRCRIFNIIYPQLSKEAIFSQSQVDCKRLEEVKTPEQVLENKKLSWARRKLELNYENYVSQMKEKNASPSQINDFETFCANNIQEWWSKNKTNYDQSVQDKIEKTVPKLLPKKRSLPPGRSEAAVIIQRSWRRHIEMQVFRYYKDLINFRNRGDPSLMLKCVNPNEAKLFDPASGIHIKFRLAGENFPPNIYYKIFTHRPIQDLCANSPKDYTSHDSKRLTARDVHNKINRSLPSERKDWYKRIENNGWRLVSDRLIHHGISDPVTWSTGRTKIDFCHNKILRKQDVEKKRKEKKLAWMKKMYKEGMLHARSEDQDTIELINGAAAGMYATVNKFGPDSVHEWEVDELLDWTTSLNFDSYVDNWKEIATSATSDRNMTERLRLKLNHPDPYSLNISSQISKDEKKHYSLNTPETVAS